MNWQNKKSERSEHYDFVYIEAVTDCSSSKSLMRVSRSIDEGLIDSEDKDSSSRWIIEAWRGFAVGVVCVQMLNTFI